MKHFFLVVLLLFLCRFAAADEPFRVHRYDAIRHLKIDTNAILFVGNSITDMFPWAEAFDGLPDDVYICNRGVSGATTKEICREIDYLVAGQPKKLFLMIGTNDLGQGMSPQDVVLGVADIVGKIRLCSPKTEVYVQSILPSEVGLRSLEKEQDANHLICHMCDTFGVTYIDLWDSMLPILTDKGFSYDGLHLTAKAYRVWCGLIAPFVGEGCVCSFAAEMGAEYRPTFGGSNGMRATYFANIPYKKSDILFFGDEMVKAGEWNELLGNRHILNRGTGWGYDGISSSLSNTKEMMAAASRVRSVDGGPKAVWVYTAVGEVNRGCDLDSLLREYQSLTNYFRTKDIPYYVLSIMPTEMANENIVRFNSMLRQWAMEEANIHYIDIYSYLAKDGVADSLYFFGNYLNENGYMRVANLLKYYVEEPENWDYRILKGLESSRTSSWTRHWIWVSNSLALSPVLSGGATLAGYHEVGISWALNAVTTMAIKYAVNRPRPWVRYEGVLHCEQLVSDPSFPSGHTSFCFNTATSLTLAFPKWYVAMPAFLWAGSVGFSRLYLGAHFPTDVISGALLGTGTALLAHYFYKRWMSDTEAPLPKDAVLTPPLTIRF